MGQKSFLRRNFPKSKLPAIYRLLAVFHKNLRKYDVIIGRFDLLAVLGFSILVAGNFEIHCEQITP